jgi:hypothetical protein
MKAKTKTHAVHEAESTEIFKGEQEVEINNKEICGEVRESTMTTENILNRPNGQCKSLKLKSSDSRVGN